MVIGNRVNDNKNLPRTSLQTSKNSHMRQIEQMESEELLAQKKLRTEVIQLEDMLAQVKDPLMHLMKLRFLTGRLHLM